MKTNKQGRIFFLTWIVIIAMAFILAIYVGHRNLINGHEGYIAGKIISPTLAGLYQGGLWLGYIDMAARRAVTPAVLGLRYGDYSQCSTPSGVPIVGPGCLPNSLEIRGAFLRGFGKALRAYIADDIINQNARAMRLSTAPTFPDYEYYILKDSVYGVPYGAFNISSQNIRLMPVPAFSAKLPFGIVGLVQDAYSQALGLEEECEGSEDYYECVTTKLEEYPGWEPFTPKTSEEEFRTFVDNYIACIESPNTNCYCELGAAADSMEISKQRFLLQGSIHIETAGSGMPVCVVSRAGLVQYDRLKFLNSRLYVWSSGHYKRVSAAGTMVKLGKFSASADTGSDKQLSCIITEPMDALQEQLGLTEMPKCSTQARVYAEYTSQYTLLAYNSTVRGVEPEPVKLLFAFEE